MNRIRSHLLNLLCISIVTVFLHPCTSLAETSEQWVAKVVSVQGSVQALRKGEEQWRPVKLNDTYCPGDIIRVQERSRADIALINQPILRLDQNSTITLVGLEEEQTSVIDLLNGAAHFFSRVPRTLKVLTAFVNAGVEGTEFFVRVEKNETFLSTFEGQVVAWNEAGRLTLTSGQSAVAEAGKAPVLRIVVRPRDAVRWALYYPPVIYYHLTHFPAGYEPDWQTMVRKSIEFYWKGDLTRAFSIIEKFPEDIGDPRFFIYRASLLLSVGHVDEAGADIKRALTLDPINSHAYALRSIIAVVQNEKEKALSLAKKAVEADTNSASARIALSYALQANFDLQGALTNLKDAVKLEPQNALAWSRLAELWLSFGDLDEALKAAKEAVALNPDLSRTQTVLGFAYLTQVKTKESTATFEKAIELDQADPLPRLGLGLAKIREGILKDGRREIEIAVSLDPHNSLIRSYLGKAYYEEKRDKLATDQFALAKEFDPLDPTPLFYDAIRKQTVNRPVEALHDLQKSVELNDNRAVYRSRLLLDSDLAARSASLARIYNDLGFQQLALVEGWRSLNLDPGDYSAHRFLADSYSVLPRHEIARVSELLQSQLLQPINITPVQPRLAESNLFILDGAGPADLSFNEFNPLFNRNRLALQASGIGGENETLGDELVHSGILGKLSYSIGQFHYEGDGFRENNYLNENIYNAFVQMSLSHKTSVQTEFRFTDTKKGDLELRFDPHDFLPNLCIKDELTSIRLGFHHAFSPGSDLIGSFMYQDVDASLHDVPPPLNLFDIKTDEDAFSGELQHLFRSKYINVISGVGHFNIDAKDVITTEFLIPFPPFLPLPPLVIQDVSTIDKDVYHTNIYLYSHINLPKNVTFTIGGSADFFESDMSDTEDRNQFNPKFGITWNPLSSTTLRAAVFRVLKRTLITNQTLEPTHVVGFNQFYDDADSTDSWRYGIAIDQKFHAKLYGGVEFSKRDLEVPAPVEETFPTERVDWEERLGRAYLYLTPHRWLALTAEYQYERFGRDREFTAGIEKVRTHRFPLGINFYHPTGFTFLFKGTYTDQDGRFEPQGTPPGTFVPGEDHFWIFDASIGYRLPKRWGLITIGAKNLFDKFFQYYDTDPVSPRIQPERLVFGRFTLAF